MKRETPSRETRDREVTRVAVPPTMDGPEEYRERDARRLSDCICGVRRFSPKDKRVYIVGIDTFATVQQPPCGDIIRHRSDKYVTFERT